MATASLFRGGGVSIRKASPMLRIAVEVFGETELKYTKPATRLTGHMEGYDPAKAPTFVWPERLQKQKAEIQEKAAKRGQ